MNTVVCAPHLWLIQSGAAGAVGWLIQQGGEKGVTPEVPSYGSLLLQTVLALILVCALAYVVLKYGLKWLMRGRIRSARLIDVVERVPLEGRRTLYVVRVGGQIYLVGATDASISLIAELDSETVERRLAAEVADTPAHRSFWDVLTTGRSSRTRRTGRIPPSETQNTSKPAPPQNPPDPHNSNDPPDRPDPDDSQTRIHPKVNENATKKRAGVDESGAFRSTSASQEDKT
jgi:flagellar biosynthetic protein FliO